MLEKRQNQHQKYCWPVQARANQLMPPGDWRTWLIMAGRGFGKTRTGAESVRQWVMQDGYRRIALLADTEGEGRDVMIEGPSGLLAIHPPHERPIYESSKRRLTWPNGAIATLFSSENPEQLRGPQFDGAWVDELAKFRNDQIAWDQLSFGLRLGHKPRIIVTTTPRPTPLIKKLLCDEGASIHVTRGSTFDNACNLAADFLTALKQRFDGTPLGQQEINGVVLENLAGALWSFEDITKAQLDNIPDLTRIIVAIDPAVTSGSLSDETGIIVAGIDQYKNAYILEDGSLKGKPIEWIKAALSLYQHYQADCIVAEVNQGGDLVASMLRTLDESVPFKGVYATRGKAIRAEPIAALYSQNRVFHKRGVNLAKLEQQMCQYIPGYTKKSPDRLDALVWALTELMVTPMQNLEPKLWSM